MAERDAIRAEGVRAVRDIESNASPFRDGWDTWRPGSRLRRPELVDGWDDLSMYVARG
jgi:hypothetical protein